MSPVHPLVFEPIFKPKLWGGRRLETLLAKSLPPDTPIGESWELVDLEDDQSVVARGPMRGRSISWLVKEWGADLLGRGALIDGRFPLLIKFLDASETLSVQVHPDEATASRLGGRVRVKHEAWYSIHAEPGSLIYRGVRPEVDASRFREAISAGTVERFLNTITARKGHAYYLPSGTVHALGGGLLVAEVQTPSDITYRVYDWNRNDPSTGLPRTLHVEEALGCIQFHAGPITEEVKQHVASVWTAVTSLVRCPSFVIERVRMVEGVDQELPYDEFMIWIVLEGRGTISYPGAKEPFPFRVGDTVLIPAALRRGRVRTEANCLWLEVSLPIASSLVGWERPPRESPVPSSEGGGLVPLNIIKK